jgi:hypothetical protein
MSVVLVCIIYLFTLSGNNKGNLQKKKKAKQNRSWSEEPWGEGLGKAEEAKGGQRHLAR